MAFSQPARSRPIVSELLITGAWKCQLHSLLYYPSQCCMEQGRARWKVYFTIYKVLLSLLFFVMGRFMLAEIKMEMMEASGDVTERQSN